MRWFVRGDIDGFFGLALDNLVQLLVINALCQTLLGMDASIVYGHILPGCAISLIIGNLFYAWQAKKIAEREGRDDICALPYGINTPSVFVYIFAVMLPVKLAVQGKLTSEGVAEPEAVTQAAKAAWQAGLVACFGSGLIEFGGAFIAEKIRKATPRAALLSTLAGIALTFISLDFLFRSFASPVVGLATLGMVMLAYFGKRRFIGGLPGGLLALAIGVALCFVYGLSPVENLTVNAGFNFPIPVFGELYDGLSAGHMTAFIAVIIPMGVFNVIGSLQNIESAEAAGDSFDTRSSLAANGMGTIAAACFGSCFPTTIYIGHPGWKAMGARAGYSLMNAVFVTILLLTPLLSFVATYVPIEAGEAIVVYIGIIIMAQAFQTTDREVAPAAVVGIMIGVGGYCSVLVMKSIRVASGLAGPPLVEKMQGFIDKLRDVEGFYLTGAFALEHGLIFSAMIISAAIAHVIQREFMRAGIWCVAGGVLCCIGIMHSFDPVSGAMDFSFRLPWDMPWSMGYFAMAIIFFLTPFISKNDDSAVVH